MHFPDKLRLVTEPQSFIINILGISIVLPAFHVLDYLSKRLKFNYNVTLVTTAHGRSSGFLEGKFDIGLAKWIMHEINFAFADFTVPYDEEIQTFMCEKSGEDPKFNAFLYPFHNDVWIFCLCFTLVATVVSKYMSSSRQKSANIFLNLVGSLLKQPLEMEVNTLRKTTWWVTWLVVAGVISFLYNAIFLNFLTVPTKAYSPKNFRELSDAVQNKNFKFFMPKSYARDLSNRPEEHLSALGKIVVKNEWYSPNVSYPVINKALCIFNNGLVLKYKIYDPPKIKHFSNDYHSIQRWVIFVRKNFCCFEQLNIAVLGLIEGGFVQKFYSEAYRNYTWETELATQAWPDDTTHALGMEDMKYPFYLLLFCYTLCIVVFLIEILLPKIIVLRILFKKFVF